MSAENVEIVRAAFDAFNRGDRDAALKDLVPNFELDMSRAIAPICEASTGPIRCYLLRGCRGGSRA